MKLIRTTLMMAAIGALSLGAFGCSKKDEKKEEPAQKVTEENKAETPTPEAPKAEEAAEKVEEAAEEAGDKAEEAADEAGDKAEEAAEEATDDNE